MCDFLNELLFLFFLFWCVFFWGGGRGMGVSGVAMDCGVEKLSKSCSQMPSRL